MTTASDSAKFSIADELAKAQSLSLVETLEVSDGVEANLQLLNQHFEIVASALDELGSEQK